MSGYFELQTHYMEYICEGGITAKCKPFLYPYKPTTNEHGKFEIHCPRCGKLAVENELIYLPNDTKTDK